MRRRAVVTLLAVVGFRIVQVLPVVGAHPAAARDFAASTRTDPLYGLGELLTGGGLLRLSYAPFGVLPIWLGSLLLGVATPLIPRVAALAAEGAAGRRLLNRYIRVPAVLCGAGLGGWLVAFAAGRHLVDGDPVPVLCMTAGTVLAMALAELISARGLGDGLAVLMLVQFLAVLPGQIEELWTSSGWAAGTVVVALLVLLVALTHLLRQAERRVPVQYAKRLIGRRPFGFTATYLPVTFARTGLTAASVALLLSLPALVTPNWLSSPWYVVAFAVLTLACTAFGAAAAFDPEQLADQLKRYGAFIPGIRSGRPTAEYLAYVHSRLTSTGALAATALATTPFLALDLLTTPTHHPLTATGLLLTAATTTWAATSLKRQRTQPADFA
ncbi:SecY family transport protein [Kitasatospora sp. NPDC002227]|uniref:SecY family transport protein n=1 Tax=Kitasatospora sp. NPDC002227 TaxID=3154773 RepID=UPI003319D539